MVPKVKSNCRCCHLCFVLKLKGWMVIVWFVNKLYPLNYNLNDGKWILSPSEGFTCFREFKFINSAHITTKFGTEVTMWCRGCWFLVYMGEGLKSKHASGGYSFIPRPATTLFPISCWSVRHTKVVVTKRQCDKTTGYWSGPDSVDRAMTWGHANLIRSASGCPKQCQRTDGAWGRGWTHTCHLHRRLKI